MDYFLSGLPKDPLPPLASLSEKPLAYFVRRDLLDEPVGRADQLWQLPGARNILRRQQEDGSWRYPNRSKSEDPHHNYDLLETFRQVGVLVQQYGFDREHPAMRGAAEFIFSCQTQEGDLRGILANQYMPYYHGAILALLCEAGFGADVRLVRGLEWLLEMRQEDGGWIVPMQAVPPRQRTAALWLQEPVQPERSRPSSHMATGMALRAFAAHPQYRPHPGVQAAARLLKARLFQRDRYNDRQGVEYWTKFQYPFWWTDLVSALDTLGKLDFEADDPEVQRGLNWFYGNQEDDGIWPTGYGKGRRAEEARRWVALGICRVLRRFSAAVD